MILIDVNLLLYASSSTSRHHESARRWLEQILSGNEPVGLCWHTILGFLRISSNPRAYERPLSLAGAVAVVSEWLDHPLVAILHSGPEHWKLLRGILGGELRSDIVADAHLAALAMEHGATLCTHDRDFERFPGLRVEFPLHVGH